MKRILSCCTNIISRNLDLENFHFWFKNEPQLHTDISRMLGWEG